MSRSQPQDLLFADTDPEPSRREATAKEPLSAAGSSASREPLWSAAMMSPPACRPTRPTPASDFIFFGGGLEARMTKNRDQFRGSGARTPNPKTVRRPTSSCSLSPSTPRPRHLLGHFSDGSGSRSQSWVGSIQSRASDVFAGLACRLGGKLFPGQRREWRPVNWNGGAAPNNHTRFRRSPLVSSGARKRWRRMRSASKGKFTAASCEKAQKGTAERGKNEREFSFSHLLLTRTSDQQHTRTPKLPPPPPPPPPQEKPAAPPIAQESKRSQAFGSLLRSRCSHGLQHQAGPSFSRSQPPQQPGMDPSKRTSWNPFNLPSPACSPLMQDEDVMKYWHFPKPLQHLGGADAELTAQRVRIKHVSVHKVTVKEIKESHVPRTATSSDSGYSSGAPSLSDARKGKDEDDIYAFMDQDAWWAATWARN